MKFLLTAGLMIFAIAALEDDKDKQRKRWDEIDWFFWRKW